MSDTQETVTTSQPLSYEEIGTPSPAKPLSKRKLNKRNAQEKDTQLARLLHLIIHDLGGTAGIDWRTIGENMGEEGGVKPAAAHMRYVRSRDQILGKDFHIGMGGPVQGGVAKCAVGGEATTLAKLVKEGRKKRKFAEDAEEYDTFCNTKPYPVAPATKGSDGNDDEHEDTFY